MSFPLETVVLFFADVYLPFLALFYFIFGLWVKCFDGVVGRRAVLNEEVFKYSKLLICVTYVNRECRVVQEMVQ